MGRLKKTDKLQAEFLEKLRENMGNVTKTCEFFGLPRRSFYDWKIDPKFQAALADIEEKNLDFAENCLKEQMEKGNITAIIYYLKCKGSGRNYSQDDKMNATLNLTDQKNLIESVNITVVEKKLEK